MFPFRLVNPDPSKPFTIGRKSDNILQFDNLMVSRYHAVLNFTDGKWILQSLTQNSITMLNGKDVTTAAISDGDVIHIGPRQLRATLRGADLTLLIMEREAESDMQTVTLKFLESGKRSAASVLAGMPAKIVPKSNLPKRLWTRAASAHARLRLQTETRAVLNQPWSGSAITIC